MEGKRRFALGAALSAILLVLGATPALAADTMSGYAYGIQVRYHEGSTDFSQGPTPVVGPFAATPDPFGECQTQSSEVGSKLTTGSLQVCVDGYPLFNHLLNSVSIDSANALSGTVTADQSIDPGSPGVYVQCGFDPNGNVVYGFTDLNNAVVAGQVFGNPHSRPAPNTVILVTTELFVGTVTLNEQTYDALTNTLTVEGIHMRGTGGTAGTGDVVIGHCVAGANPGGPGTDIPESPFAILIPLIGLTVIGGVWYLRRNPSARARL